MTREGRVMLVTEYMSGGDLWHALGKPAVSRAVFGWHVWGHKVAVDLARGLHFLHSRSPTIVHFECVSVLCRTPPKQPACTHGAACSWHVWGHQMAVDVAQRLCLLAVSVHLFAGWLLGKA